MTDMYIIRNEIDNDPDARGYAGMGTFPDYALIAADMNIEIDSKSRALDVDLYEVVLTLTATTKVSEKTAYLAEVQQAGIFSIVGLTSREIGAVLGSYCPSVLYPYAREMVSDLVIRGGFPPFVLAPVNFDALYAHQQAGQKTSPTP